MKHPHFEKQHTEHDLKVIADVELPGSPDEIWNLLTTAQGLTRWFPPNAHVNPGKDGTWAITWGDKYSWVDRIVDWKPGERLLLQPLEIHEAMELDGMTVSRMSEPYPYAMEFTLTGRGGSTNLRLVQSNFLASDNWEEELDSYGHGWIHQFYSLVHWLENHRDEQRTFVRSNVEKQGDKREFWDRVVSANGVLRPKQGGSDSPSEMTLHVDGRPPMKAEVLYYEPGRQLIANLPELNNSLFGFGIWHHGDTQWLVSDVNYFGLTDAEARDLSGKLEAAYQAAI